MLCGTLWTDPTQMRPLADSQQGTETLTAKVYKELHPATIISISLKVGSLDETSVLTDTFVVTLWEPGAVFSSVSSVAQLCLTLHDPMDCSRLGFPITNFRSLLKLMSTPSMMPPNLLISLSSPSPPALNLSQHQDLFQWVSSSHQMAKVLEFQLQHQSFQWIFRTDFLYLFAFFLLSTLFIYVFFSFIFISWRLITLQYWSGFCHTLTWISHGVTCVPHSDSPSHLPLHPIPLGLPSAPGLSTCLMHLPWAGELFHPR